MHILPDVSLTLVYGIVLIFVAIQAVASDILDPSLVVALLFKACMFLL